jgi:hypothetical protein
MNEALIRELRAFLHPAPCGGEVHIMVHLGGFDRRHFDACWTFLLSPTEQEKAPLSRELGWAAASLLFYGDESAEVKAALVDRETSCEALRFLLDALDHSSAEPCEQLRATCFGSPPFGAIRR